jgi:hypothetical protein
MSRSASFDVIDRQKFFMGLPATSAAFATIGFKDFKLDPASSCAMNRVIGSLVKGTPLVPFCAALLTYLNPAFGWPFATPIAESLFFPLPNQSSLLAILGHRFRHRFAPFDEGSSRTTPGSNYSSCTKRGSLTGSYAL